MTTDILVNQTVGLWSLICKVKDGQPKYVLNSLRKKEEAFSSEKMLQLKGWDSLGLGVLQ